MSITHGTPLSDALGPSVQIVGAGISGPVMGLMGYDVTHSYGNGPQMAAPSADPVAPPRDFMADFKPGMGG